MSEDSELVLKAIIEQTRDKDYPSLKPDKFFEIFGAQQVLKSIRFDPDPVEIESGIIGGDGDGGVDGFYLFVNRKFIREDTDLSIFKDQQLNFELVIIQAKHKASFEESVPHKFQDFSENCLRLNADISDNTRILLYNDRLSSLVKQFHDIYKPSLSLRPRLNISFYHVSLSDNIDSKVVARSEILKQKVKEFFPAGECDYCFVRGSELLKLYNQHPEKTLPLKTPKYFDYSSFGKTAYMCVVTIPDYFTFITENDILREYIFEANVRDHAPDAKVNKGIRATLAVPENDDFWWLNNGITILSSNVIYVDGALQITDPMIVNGLQTSHELFNHFKGGGSREDKRALMVKVIKTTDEATSDRIINATNSQTKIEPINLHATEQIHRNIESALKLVGLFYDRRKNFYRNQGKPASQIVTIGYMAQAVAAIVLQQPDNARARPTTVAQKNYKALFSEEYPILLYSKCAQIMKCVDSYLDEKGLAQGKKLNLVFYLAMYATCVALNSVKPVRKSIASLDMSVLTSSILDKCYDWLVVTFDKHGGDDKTAKGPMIRDELKLRLVQEFGKRDV